MLRAARSKMLIVCLLCSSVIPFRSADSAPLGIHLKLIRTVVLSKSQGQVDQVVELPDGSLLVRDSTFDPLTLQSVELYGRSGNLIKKIGTYGKEPGQYYALQKIAFSQRSNLIWIVDKFGRLSRFDLSGKLIDSMLVQKPGYHPYDLALDESQNRYYLTGCVALHFYLDLGCQIVHRYELSSNQYDHSFLETDSEAVTKKYFGIENYLISVAPSGAVYAIDSPIHKFWKISPEGTVESFPVNSKIMESIPALDPSKNNSSIANQNYIFDRIVVGKQNVILAAYKKAADSCLLQVFTLDGKPVALDATAPARLVGDSPRGTLWFGQHTASQFRLLEYSY